MLLTIGLIILALWLLGFAVHVGGALIHLLLIVGLIVLVMHFMRGRRARV